MVNHSREAPEFMQTYVSRICSQALRIPPAFIKKYGNVPQRTKLKGPRGRSSPIVARKVGSDFFFQDGWPEFVKDNAIEELDFLTFAYYGSKFDVTIFGKNGLKKVIPTYTKNDTKAEFQNQTSLSGKSTCNRVIPQFEVIMRSSYVTKCLSVTKRFSQKYIKAYVDSVKNCGGRQKVILQIKDKSWKVNVCKSGPRYQFSKGWHEFVKDNLLKADDRCKFELIKRNPFVLKVTIIKSF